MVPLPRSGAPHAIIEEERDTLVDIVENENPFITWCDLTGEMESAGEPFLRGPFLTSSPRGYELPKMEESATSSSYGYSSSSSTSMGITISNLYSC
jgi:hypothetical protein